MSESYTGDVVPGGPSAVRELDDVVIRKASLGPLDNNAYLLTCRTTGAQLLIDAADDPDRVLSLVREGSGAARLDLVVTTHRHADHHRALASIVAVTGAPSAAGAPDIDGIDAEGVDPAAMRPLHHGETLQVGRLELEVVALRGHTEGSVALVYREPDAVAAPGTVPGRAHVFTGDSLFPGGLGSTNHDPARFAQLYEDVTTRLFDALPDDTWVYPGHGRDTTLGAERGQLAQWRERGW